MMDIEAKYSEFYRQPLEQIWPEEDLEKLGRCPVCGCRERVLAYEGLRDKTFFCAPGTWTSWRCGSCAVVYLDPRPTVASIGRAYGTYYTHQAESKSFFGKLLYAIQLGIRHSYLNKEFGYRLKGALPFGWIAYRLMPSQVSVTRNTVRDLPSPKHEGSRLLDVGAGNGEFLNVAGLLGYEAEGLEIDPAAYETARQRGLRIHLGTMPGSGLLAEHYDQITFAHVLEHFHDPYAALAEAFALLRPGGRIWIQIPNIAAQSLVRFGANSRLLEPPRHLVMFDSQSLRQIMERVGFQDVELLNMPNAKFYYDMLAQSWMIEQGLDPVAIPHSLIPPDIKSEAQAMYRRAAGEGDRAEIITMTGVKRLPANVRQQHHELV